jgi:putative DNA methylase
VTVWEVTQQLIRELDSGGEDSAGALLKKVGGLGEVARDLAYRLYGICERKKWAQEALAYNTLVVSWPAIVARAASMSVPTQPTLM